jgi:hypothetical protein
MPKHQVIVSGEFHNHQILWGHAALMRELHIQNKNGDAYVDVAEALECSILLNVAFALEAHANYLLEAVCPTAYENERTLFSKGPYRGTLGKLRFLSECLNVSLDKGRRPFQTVKQLFDWRNLIAHSRIERPKEKIECTDLDKIPLPESRRVNAYKEPWAGRIFEDSQDLCSSLQRAAHDKGAKGILGPEAFSGFLGTRGTQII